MRCRSHSIYFTLYPYGHVPYGREPLVGNISACGKSILDETSADLGLTRHPSSAQGTIFEAALDASNKKTWPKEGAQGSLEPRLPTMQQKLDRGSRLLGLHETLSSKQWESTSQILELAGQVVIDYRNELKGGSTPSKMGEAIHLLLQMVPQSILLYERFTEVGAIVGLWPTPHFYNSKVNRLKKSSFHRIGIRGSP